MTSKQQPSRLFSDQGRSPPGPKSAVDITTHELKSWPEFFQAIIEGRKTHDLRRADDRSFRVNDLIRLREFDPQMELYTGREATAQITYITSAGAPCALSDQALNQEFCILSIQKLT
jgi:hypothetical protein